MSDRVLIELQGVKPGPWCQAYHKDKNRDKCAERRCRYYYNHRVSPITPGTGGAGGDNGIEIDYAEDGTAISVKHPKVWFGGKEFFEVHEECAWHCVKFDEPSKYVDLPWEMG